jgi:hypothetical protein
VAEKTSATDVTCRPNQSVFSSPSQDAQRHVSSVLEMSMDWDGFETSTVPEEVKNNSGKVKLKRQETKVTRHKTAIAEVLRQCQHESKDDAYAFGTSNHEKTLSDQAREHFIAKYFFPNFDFM